MGVLQGLVSNGNYLYAASKGEPNDDRLFYSRWSGNSADKWAPAAPMGNGTVAGNSSAGPSLGSVGGTTLYAGWKGEYSDPRLFFAKYDGSNWQALKQIPNAYSDVGPALCGFGPNLIAAWKNVFDQNLYFATYNGSWSTPSQIPGVASSVGPSLAAYGTKLYAVWKGEGTDQSLYYALYDGHTWSGQIPGTTQTQIPGVGSDVGASLASVSASNKLYAVWKGEGTDQSLYCAQYDGNKWSGLTPGSSQTQIPGSGSSVGAAIAEFGGNIYAMCKGRDSDARLYNAEFTNGAWHSWANDIPGNTGPDTDTTLVKLPNPRASDLPGSSNYWFYDSSGDSKHLTNASVTVLVTEDIVPVSNEKYSFQMNCWSPSPPKPTSCAWQQFGFRISDNLFFFWVNTFSNANSKLIEWDSRKPPNKYTHSLTNNTLPKGWQFTVILATDPNSGYVTGVSFTLVDNNNTIKLTTPTLGLVTLTSGATPSINAGDLAAISSVMPVLVGEVGGATTNFASAQGFFLVDATNNLAVRNSKLHDSNFFTRTLEQSNISYSSLPLSYPNGEFYQLFGVLPF